MVSDFVKTAYLPPNRMSFMDIPLIHPLILHLISGSEQKLLEVEDIYDGERKDATVKIDSLTSIVKMFELKTKNYQDQISRLEEKESETKKEYTKLHDRYSELFKTHLDYMEKTKSVIGAEKLEQLQQGFGVSRPRIGGMALTQLTSR